MTALGWAGSRAATSSAEVDEALHDTASPYLVVEYADGVGLTRAGDLAPGGAAVVGVVPALGAETVGSEEFRRAHGVRHSLMTGAMANGIASEEMVTALARAGFLAAFGCAGLLPDRVDRGIERIRRGASGLPYACNLIHSPSELALERGAVELFLRHGVPVVEASAFLDLTPTIVRYRAAGLRRGPDGAVIADHRVIAKVSRAEVAEKFLRPAPVALLDGLVADGLLTSDQRDLALRVPMADDITVEADSGGHTDNRPLPAIFPALALLRDRVAAEDRTLPPTRLGAAGGIGTPAAAAAAFTMGADYVVTGSVNQACLESGASELTRRLLAEAGVADFAMAPAADMFELGVDLQVLQRGTMFAQRARLLRTTYTGYEGLDDLPDDLRTRLERQVFRQPLAQVWHEVENYFARRDPDQLTRAAGNPKRRMALVFRWYLGMSSRWSNTGQADRAQDFQIWSGPAMGSFNEWARGSYLAAPENRQVVDVNHQLIHGAAVQLRVSALRASGAELAPSVVGASRPRTDHALAAAEGR